MNFSASSASSARAAPPRPPRRRSAPLTLYSARLALPGHSELKMTANAATLGGSADQAKAVKPVPLEQFDSVFGSLIGAFTRLQAGLGPPPALVQNVAGNEWVVLLVRLT